MTPWKLSLDGLTASRTLDNGSVESRLVCAIPSEDTILPADPLTPEQQRAIVQDQIDSLERQYMLPRGTREALLAYAVLLAANQGIDEAALYAANIAYRKTKDFDTQIAALRAQL